MADKSSENKKPNKFKVYAVAILIYLLVNGLIFETLITLLENQLRTYLNPILPFTRIGLLIIPILLARRYIAKRSPEPPKKRSTAAKVTKYILLTLVFIGLAYGAMLAMLFYDDSPTPTEPIVIPELPQATPLEISPYVEN